MKTNTTSATFAICQFYDDGTIFPVRLETASHLAPGAVSWMKVGAGSTEDWRAIPMSELAKYTEDKLVLSCFTKAAKQERLAIIAKYR